MKRDLRARRDRYRGLRGLVRHVLWRPRSRHTPKPPPEGPVVRDPAARIAHGGVWGRCTWCGLPATAGRTGRKLKWHNSCVRYYLAAAGQQLAIRELKRALAERCICGDPKPYELDHRLAIGVAQRLAERLGRKIYAVAFLESNLWWLCHDCHVAKTNFDRAWMRQLDNPAEDEPILDFVQMRFALEPDGC